MTSTEGPGRAPKSLLDLSLRELFPRADQHSFRLRAAVRRAVDAKLGLVGLGADIAPESGLHSGSRTAAGGGSAPATDIHDGDDGDAGTDGGAAGVGGRGVSGSSGSASAGARAFASGGGAAGAGGSGGSGEDGVPAARAAADGSELLLGPMNRVALEALQLAFERYQPRTEVDLVRSLPPGVRITAHDMRVLFEDTISLGDFDRALRGLGLPPLPSSALAATLGALDIARSGRVLYKRFVRFVSMPARPGDMLAAAAAAARRDFAPSGGPPPAAKQPAVLRAMLLSDRAAAEAAERSLRFGGADVGTGLTPDNSGAHHDHDHHHHDAAGGGMGTRGVEALGRGARVLPVEDEHDATAALLAAMDREGADDDDGKGRGAGGSSSSASVRSAPSAAAPGSTHGAGGGAARKGGPGGSGAAPVMPDPWSLLPANASTARQRPRFSVGWPVDVASPSSPFWAAVNGLEAALANEVLRRATVRSTAPQPGGEFATVSQYGRSALPETPGAVLLRRAFAFLDRSSSRSVSVADLHGVLADLGLVDPPLPAEGAPAALPPIGPGADALPVTIAVERPPLLMLFPGHSNGSGIGSGIAGVAGLTDSFDDEGAGIPLAPAVDSERAQLSAAAAATSPLKGRSRIAGLRSPPSSAARSSRAAAASSSSAATAASGDATGAALGFADADAAAPSTGADLPDVGVPASAADVAAAAAAAGFASGGAGAGVGMAGAPLSHPSTLEQQLGLGARKLVIALFRRMHGEGDIGIAVAGAHAAAASAEAADAAAGGASGGGMGATGRGSGSPSKKAAAARAAEESAAVRALGGRVGLATLDERDALVATPLTYSAFAKWVAPLNSRLRTILDRIQAAFRRHATLGGGRKDFAHAFRKISSSQRSDGALGPKELRELLGAVGRSLSLEDIDALISSMDVDGNGELDVLEVLAASLAGRPHELAALLRSAEEKDERDDPYAGGPAVAEKAEMKSSANGIGGKSITRVKYTLV